MSNTATLEQQQTERMLKALEEGLYSIYDKTSETYSPLRGFKNDEQAQRWFKDVCENDKEMVHKHPADFNLVKCAIWTPILGKVISIDNAPITLANGLDYTNNQNTEE